MLNKETLEAMANNSPLRERHDEEVDSHFECPKCFSSHFGAWSEEVFCHDEYNRGCNWHGPRSACFVYEYSKQTLAAELLEAYKHIKELEKK